MHAQYGIVQETKYGTLLNNCETVIPKKNGGPACPVAHNSANHPNTDSNNTTLFIMQPTPLQQKFCKIPLDSCIFLSSLQNRPEHEH
jgi:hypothetical protein